MRLTWQRVTWVGLLLTAMVLTAILADDDTAQWVLPLLGGVGAAGPGIAQRLP